MHRTLDLCIISASNLSIVEDDAGIFVVAWLISGADNPTAAQSTTLVSAKGDNPTWNFPLQFAVSDLITPEDRHVVWLQVRCYHQQLYDWEEEIGEVFLPVDDLLDFHISGSTQFVTYPIRNKSGTPIGKLNLSYKVREGDPESWRTPTPSAPPLPPPPEPPPSEPLARGRTGDFRVVVAVTVAALVLMGQPMAELLVKLQELVVRTIAMVLAVLVLVGFLISLPDLIRRFAAMRGGAHK